MPKSKPTRGSEVMLPVKIFDFKSPEMAGNACKINTCSIKQLQTSIA